MSNLLVKEEANSKTFFIVCKDFAFGMISYLSDNTQLGSIHHNRSDDLPLEK